MTSPSAVSARLCTHPPAMAMTPDCAASGTSRWPQKLSPQAMTSPASVSARLWYPPPAMAMTPDCAAAGTSHWPSVLSPQAMTSPASTALGLSASSTAASPRSSGMACTGRQARLHGREARLHGPEALPPPKVAKHRTIAKRTSTAFIAMPPCYASLCANAQHAAACISVPLSTRPTAATAAPRGAISADRRCPEATRRRPGCTGLVGAPPAYACPS